MHAGDLLPLNDDLWDFPDESLNSPVAVGSLCPAQSVAARRPRGILRVRGRDRVDPVPLWRLVKAVREK